MDGLLVDTEPLWTIAENEICARFGGVFTAEAKAAMVGHRLDSAVPLLVEHLARQGLTEVTPELVVAGLLGRMLTLFDGELPLLPGALELLAACAGRGLPSALVSSSYRSLVDAVLARLPDGTFVASIAGDEVIHAKPHPEPYLTAAARLGVSPGECLVLEDSPTGMRSGLAAGCQAVMVPSVRGVEVDPAWTVVGSLVELSLDDLAGARS